MKITDNIHQLRIDFNIQLAPDKILPRFVNVIIVFGEKITLIDTGVKGSETTIFDYIRENGYSIADIETVILSHSHPDHIGGAARIKALTGCKIWTHEGEKEWIDNIEKQNQERPVPSFFNLVDRSVRIDEFLSNGQILELGEGGTVEAIHTPGHSAGMLSLLFREKGVLFTGDAIPLKNDIPNYDNYLQLMASLDLIKKLDYQTLLTSWTPAYTDKEEIEKLIAEGEAYLKLIDKTVKGNYIGQEMEPLQFCRKTAAQLGLPPFLANQIVDRAFRSHYAKYGK
jgi:glyoxylase-like metal-dependent hydrolase (beta-lactamase superfamily II)